MYASASLIPELEDIIQHGTRERRAATVKRIANLFVDSAREHASQSSMVMLPSGRSAITCTVQPSEPEMRTRTSR